MATLFSCHERNTRNNLKDNSMNNQARDLIAELKSSGIEVSLNKLNQLKTIASQDAMTPKRIALIKENKENIITYLTTAKSLNQSIEVTQNDHSLKPLSFQQQSLWFAFQLDPEAANYNMPLYLMIEGPIESKPLQQSLQQLVERHAIFRTNFSTDDEGQSHQLLSQLPQVELSELDYRDDSVRIALEKLEKRCNTLINQPFDLSKDLLIRATLIKMPKQQNAILLTFHHIVADGWSAGIIMAELNSYYSAYSRNSGQGTALKLPPNSLNYADFATWQKKAFDYGLYENDKRYWLHELANLPECHQLPLDFTRPAKQSFNGNTVSFILKESTTQQLNQYCQSLGTTLFTGIQTVFAILVARYSAQTDIAIGYPVANRMRQEVKDMIGYFVNTAVMRTNLTHKSNFKQLLISTRDKLVKQLEHQQFPFEKLVDELVDERSLSITPLVQLMFVFQPLISAKFADHSFTEITPTQAAAKFDLTLKATQRTASVQLDWLFNTNLFDYEKINRMACHFSILLEQLLAAPEIPVSTVPFLLDSERKQLEKLAATEYPRPTKTVLEKLHYWAKKQPEAIALQFGNDKLSYTELQKKTSDFANVLHLTYLKQHGQALPAGSLIAICLERSIDMVIALIAVQQAGCIYIPIEPSAPQQRKEYILADCQPKQIITNESFDLVTVRDYDCQIITIKKIYAQNLSKKVHNTKPSAESIAYAIYTSGTTGHPKAALIAHYSLYNLAQQKALKDQLSITSSVYLSPSYAFDASIEVIFSTLFSGASLCISKIPGVDGDEIRDYKVSHITASSAVANLFITETFPHLRHISFGGEKLAEDIIQQLLVRYETLSIEYGVTEASCSNSWITRIDHQNSHTIGKPVPGNKIYLLDEYLNVVANGIVGQIAIAGVGVAHGYLNRPEMTAQRFIINPYNKNETLYLTGDLARFDHNGNLLFIGRNDTQIKLRGYRIEPGEIENALASHADIGQAHVIVSNHNDSYPRPKLTVYVTSENEISLTDITPWLKQRIPDYMMPELLLTLPQLPLTQNGKIDNNSLPKIAPKTETTVVLATTDTEKVILSIWQTLLSRADICIHANFFQLGGDSILSIQVASQIRDAGHPCTVKLIFENPTISELAFAIDSETELLVIDAEQGILEGEFNLLPIQSWFFKQNFAKPHHWNQSILINIPELDIDQLAQAIAQLVDHHDALRLKFELNKQCYQSSIIMPSLPVIEVCDDNSELNKKLTQLQNQFDFINGPLWQFAYIKTKDRQAKLFMAFHHLIVDAVSWRIIIDDLKKILNQQKLNEKTSSYRQWVNTVNQYAQNNNEQLIYWQSQLPEKHYSPLNWKTQKNINVAELSLNNALTNNLISSVSQAYNTEINDILLTALADSLHRHNGVNEQFINLEGHGREAIANNIDVSRTVGWFTTEYPIKLNGAGTWHDKLIANKEQLRNVPDKGIGFSILKENDNNLNEYEAALSFNYLGQLDNQQKSDLWQITSDNSGDSVSKENHNPRKLSINGAIINEQLTLTIHGYFTAQQLATLAQLFERALTQLINYCVERQAKKQFWLTPSDAPEATINQSLLDELQLDYQLEAVFPATGLQQGFIYHAINQQEDDAYRVQLQWRYQQAVDVEALRQAWRATITQYPALRLAFHWRDSMLQLVNRQVEDNFNLLDFSQENAIEEAIETLQMNERMRAFDLSKPGLFRLHCIKMSNQEFTLLLTMHHAIGDGWSNPVLLQSLHQHYATIKHQQPLRITPDNAYLKAQKWYIEQQDASNLHWNEYLKNFEYANDLSSLFDSTVDLAAVHRVAEPAMSELTLQGSEFVQLKSVLTEYGLSINLAVQFVWHKLIRSYTRDQLTAVGTILSGRDIAVSQVERSVGLYINTLPLLVDWQQHDLCLDILQQMQQDIAAMNTYSSQPLAKLQRNGEPLFHSLLVFENYPVPPAADTTDEHQLHAHFDNALEKVDYPLGVLAFEQTDKLGIRLNFDHQQMSLKQANTLAAQLKELLTSLTKNITKPHSQLGLLCETDKKAHFSHVLGPVIDTPADTVIALFEQIVSTHPDGIAIEHNNEKYSYAQLNHKANQLACYLQSLELPHETYIGFCFPRSYDMIVAILAILKAGYAYVPLDPNYPEARLAYIIEDSGLDLVLSHRAIAHKIDAVKTLAVNVDEKDFIHQMQQFDAKQPMPLPNGNQLAYLIYTSGSTGNPKGVMIEHRSLVNTIYNQVRCLCIDHTTVFLHCTSMSFDAGTAHLFKALCGGAHLILADPDEALMDIMKDKAVTHSAMPMSLLDGLERRKLPAMKALSVGGDKCPPALVNFWSQQCEFINMYGPTEAAIIASHKSVKANSPITLGKPLDNTFALVLDDALNLCPPGVPGELHLGGRGLARGYWQRPDLTEQAFISNPYLELPGNRLYKTGDLVTWDENYELCFLGRIDHQVKIRGFRIELGEIESTIRQLTIENTVITEAVVQVHQNENGTKHLVAYIVSSSPIVDIEILKSSLATELPSHMVPSIYQILDVMPLTPNGKIDKRALPKPEWQQLIIDYVAPSSDLERILCDNWQLLLNRPQIGIEDDFYQIGGDSILAIQLTSKLRDEQVNCTVQDIFDSRNIKQLALTINANADQVEIDAEQGALVGEFPLHPIQQWFFGLALPDSHYFNQAFLIQVPALEIKQLKQAILALTSQHDILRAEFNTQNQTYKEQFSDVEIIEIDAREFTPEELQEQLTLLQNNFNFENGPLWKVAYINDTTKNNARIFFAAHHLIIDAVSWRIIAEDLQKLYHGQQLAPKSSSYRQWQAGLTNYANQHDDEYRYWLTQTQSTSHCWPGEIGEKSNQFIEMSTQVTQQLLTDIHSAFSTEINDILLSSVALAVSELIGCDDFSIILEGHGREAIIENLDINRTVGWFTSAYPLVLQRKTCPLETLIATKESLRKVPNKGAAYGAFKYLRAASKLVDNETPLISFNYLGQFEQQAADWQVTAEEAGITTSESNRTQSLDAKLAINCRVVDSKLNIFLSGQLNQQLIQHLGQLLQEKLTLLVSECLNKSVAGKTHFTPSDFPECNLTITHLDHLQEQYSIEKVYPATALQQGLVYHAIQYPDDLAYRVQSCWDYLGSFDQATYLHAWQIAIQQFPALRVAFNWQESLLQVISNSVDLKWRSVELVKEVSKQRQLQQIKTAELSQGFDLSMPGLFRLVIVRQSKELVSIIKTEHHSIGDGWSGPVLLSRIHQIYQQLMNKQQIEVLHDNTYYKVQQYYVKQKKVCKDYWSNHLTDIHHGNDLGLMLDHGELLAAHKTVQKVGEISWESTEDELFELSQCLKTSGATLHAALQFAWHKLIHCYSGDKNTIVGTTVSGRDIPVADIAQSAGLYINTLPLIVNWEQKKSIESVIQQIQQRVTDMNRYSFQPLAEIQPQGIRLFHSLVVFENYPIPPRAQERQQHELVPIFYPAVEQASYPLGLVGYERENRLGIKLQYDKSLMSDDSAKRLINQLKTILLQLSRKWLQPVETLILGSRDISVLHGDNAHFPVHAIHQLFEQQVNIVPQNIALKDENDTINYANLNKNANRIAHWLTQNKIVKGDIVAICLPKDIELIATILGILKAGAAYLPIDYKAPVDRVHFMVEDAKPVSLLTNRSDLQALSTIVNMQQPLDSQLLETLPEFNPTAISISLDDLAYVVYTSGTTGKPKGVMINHRGPVSLFQSDKKTWEINQQSRILHPVNMAFDAGTQNLFVGLSHGAQVHLRAGTDNLIDYIEQQHITHYCGSIGLLQSFPYRDLPNLKTIVVGGDKCDMATVNIWAKQAKFLNVYGPTEASITTSYKELKPNQTVSIGRPIPGCSVYVVDTIGQLVPRGVPGELVIGGHGIAKGYLGQPELTEKVFKNYDFSEQKRVYHSGDHVLINHQDEIMFLGRKDNQIKIRGYRVELEEIERICLTVASIIQCKIVPQNIDNKELLVGYFVSSSAQCSDVTNQAKSAVDTALPDYMRPTHWVEVEYIPLTSNLKVDTKSLPLPELLTHDYIAPTTPLEQNICSIWQDILGLEQVGLSDNFYQLGGQSLLALKLVSRLQQELKRKITIHQLIENPTPAALCKTLMTKELYMGEPLTTLFNNNLTNHLFIIPAAGLTSMSYHALAQKLNPTASVHVFEAENLVNKFGKPENIEQLARQCMTVMTDKIAQIKAPITIIGHSFGGCVAFELTHLLRAYGIQIKLVLIETRLDGFTKRDNVDSSSEIAEQTPDNKLLITQQEIMSQYKASQPIDADLTFIMTKESLAKLPVLAEQDGITSSSVIHQKYCLRTVCNNVVSGGHLSCLTDKNVDDLVKCLKIK